MYNKMILPLGFAFLISEILGGDVDEYYSGIDFSATNNELKAQLQNLISPHTVLSYDDAWAAFGEIDKTFETWPCNADEAEIPDIYSSFCWTVDSTTTGGQCGNYHKEGDCFNREHIWPKSWFGGFDYGANAQTDMFELWATDGYVNGMRGNLPLGYVDLSQKVSYQSSNGCLVGRCMTYDDTKDDDYSYDGSCFEVADMYKGDVARSYFYLSTAYWNAWDCCDDIAVNRSDIKPWMERELREWHKLDPVDDYERSRNDIIFSNYQHNRNPFIDYPEFVDQIDDF